MPSQPIGQSMIEASLITSEQLVQLLDLQARSEDRALLGKLSVESGMVNEEEFAVFLASYFDVPYTDLNDYSRFQKEAIDLIPEPLARRFNILPISMDNDTLTVAMSDPIDLNAIENIEAVAACRVKPVVSAVNRIKKNISLIYSGKKEMPVGPALVKLLVEKALSGKIDFVHIQPEKTRVKIFFRINNKLEKIASYPSAAFSSIIDFIRKSARLESDNKDLSQSGYFTVTTADSNVEIGVSTFPTIYGDRVVLEVPRRVGWLDDKSWLKDA